MGARAGPGTVMFLQRGHDFDKGAVSRMARLAGVVCSASMLTV